MCSMSIDVDTFISLLEIVLWSTQIKSNPLKTFFERPQKGRASLQPLNFISSIPSFCPPKCTALLPKQIGVHYPKPLQSPQHEGHTCMLLIFFMDFKHFKCLKLVGVFYPKKIRSISMRIHHLIHKNTTSAVPYTLKT